MGRTAKPPTSMHSPSSNDALNKIEAEQAGGRTRLAGADGTGTAERRTPPARPEADAFASRRIAQQGGSPAFLTTSRALRAGCSGPRRGRASCASPITGTRTNAARTEGAPPWLTKPRTPSFPRHRPPKQRPRQRHPHPTRLRSVTTTSVRSSTARTHSSTGPRRATFEAIRALGFDYDEPEDPTPDDVEDPSLRRRARRVREELELKQWKQAQEAERVASGIRSHVDSLAQEAGLELTDYDKEVIFRGAVGGDKIGAEVDGSRLQGPRRLPQQPSGAVLRRRPPRPGTGQAVEKQPDLDDPQERRAWMKAQLGL
jgi:hypothetical protein